ncbi:helix-turn-helix transcriptional regulator [Streptomyces luteolifulvus]|uniref:Helix-turn-helix transcriptional regulator n=1 Tax=Streptomyces luteolifulvus TaxID=2615112 RepID=A0A6H9V5V6_9ACTN|nr:helix-turn-helix transcriptional regulator [Streptomyces luteolifulvus]KAB1149249.1 helix-turn-helix transcriptional regulator [Streptomyces luteolifulvus]
MTANETPEPSKGPGWGPTSRHVAANLKRLRTARGLSTTRLSDALKEAGQPIPATGITRIEKGERRVDVDDLTALAVVLGVSPSALLLPPTKSPQEVVEITGGGEVASDTAWAWADGTRPLRMEAGHEYAATLEYALYSRPPWLQPGGPQGYVGEHAKQAAKTTELADLIGALLSNPTALREFLKEHDRPEAGGE